MLKNLQDAVVAEEGWREVEGNPEGVCEEVTDVSKEDAERAKENRERKHPEELDNSNEWKREDPWCEPFGVDEVEAAERQEPEEEAGATCGERGDREDDVRECDLTHHLVLHSDRTGSAAERHAKPAPREDGREKEERKGWLRPIQHHANEEVVDRKLDRWVKDEPEIAKQGVAAISSDLRNCEVEEEATPLDDALDRVDNRPDWTEFWAPHGQPKRLCCHGRERIASTPYTDPTCPKCEAACQKES